MNEWRQAPILVVDDFAMVVRIVRQQLNRNGFLDIDSASNGAEALEMMAKKRYALVISDWHMEPVTGFQLLQKMRADPALVDVPFIMATVEARPQYVAAARNAGATDYILKPFTGALLRMAVNAAFAHRPGQIPSYHFDGSFVPPDTSAHRKLVKAARDESMSIERLAKSSSVLAARSNGTSLAVSNAREATDGLAPAIETNAL